MSKRITKYSVEYWIKLGFNEKDSIQKVSEYKLKTRKNKKNCIEYWLHRNFSEKNAILEVKKFQSENSKKRKNKFTPSQVNFWKIKGFSEEESRKKVVENIKKTRSWSVDFWKKKGLSEKEAIKKIKLIQSNNSKKRKNFNNGRNIEKYLKLGFTKEEAIKKLKDLQSTNLLSNFIKRYGDIEGHKKWISRQEKWQHTLKKRFTKEERKKWCSFTYEDYIKKYGKERADKWLKNKMHSNGKTYSNIQLKLFKPLSKIINEDCYFGENEYVIKRNKWTFILDFYVPKFKKVIEFNGDFWHANPIKYKSTDICNPFSKETAKEIWDKDKNRIKNLKNDSCIDNILIIWESEFKKNKELILAKCIKFLKNE